MDNHSKSIRNLPDGHMENIRKRFEAGQPDCQTSQTVTQQSCVPQQPKPVPRTKPKISDLPAKPRIYTVPVSISTIDSGAFGSSNTSDEHDQINESPKKVTESKPTASVVAHDPDHHGGDKTVYGNHLLKKSSFNVHRQFSREHTDNDKDITSELEIKLRRRQEGNALRGNPNRRSEADITDPSVGLRTPASPKRFSDSFDNSPVKSSDHKIQSNLKPASGSTIQSELDSENSESQTYGIVDISAKAKMFESKKPVPERPALPKNKPRHIRQRSAGSAVEYAQINKPKKIATSEHAIPEPPMKPPRTHAHDDYLKVKLQQKQVIVMKNVLYESVNNVELNKTETETDMVSIKDRISQFHQSKLSQDDTVIKRNRHPPLRPPPPKQRPFSEMTPSSSSNYSAKACLFYPKNAPEIPDSTPPREVYEHTTPSNKYATIQRRGNRPNSSGESDSNEILRKKSTAKQIPIRRSLSSECLYVGNGICERFYHDPNEFVGRDETYEAYVDNEGYAVPNKFIKRKVREKISCPESTHDRPLTEALKAKFDGIKKRMVPENRHANTSNNSQFSDDSVRFNKRNVNQVREKINQAFSILRRYVQRHQESDTQDDVDADTLSNDSDSFVDVEEIMKRKSYATTIRKNTFQSIKKSKEFSSNIYPQLFEYAVIVGLRPVPAGQGYEAYIIHKFPEIVDSNVSVPLFCFPDASDYKAEKHMKSEFYSFVLTNFDGGRVFGYCRRIQPPDSKLPEVICIISPVDASNMYNTLLHEIELRRMISLELAKELLASSFGRPLPKPGKDVQIRCLDEVGEMETVHLRRPSDARLENVNYDSLLTYLGTDKLIKVFSSLLLERRVILYSKSLSCLTHVIHAVTALLYPFHWQHIYIPILPSSMLEVCCSPTPYLIGILTTHLNTVLEMPLDEVMIVDLDKKSIIMSVGDEGTMLPKKITKALKMAINMCKIDIEAEHSQSLMISEAFLRVFVETVGHYGEFITTQQDGKKMFLKENFMSKIESHGLQQFLEWFTETQMFEVFITNHLEKREWGTVDVFMARVMDNNKDGDTQQFERAGIGKKVKNFRKAFKSKLG